MLGQLRKGDVLVVWKLDRLSRFLKDVLLLMEKVEQAGGGRPKLKKHQQEEIVSLESGQIWTD